jgi:flagellar biosynthesis protein FlhA
MSSLAPDAAMATRTVGGGDAQASTPQRGRGRARPAAGGHPVASPAGPAASLRRLGDILVAGSAIVIALLLLAPLAPWIVDVLVAANLAGSVLVLFVAAYTTDPLQFSVFPSVLLMSTVFRLAINVALTRLILLQGSAGGLVAAFGNVVMGGNPVVGFVLFFILMIVQFVVLSSGAGRMAEVAARFTLDAMPGKQMAIDADLNAGIITEDVARARRRAIEQQADFYGAMDGASKFVRGDAMASAVIVLVDLIGGIALGAFGRGMDLMQALQVFTVLTVGAGLAIQVPALLVSTASGLLVTRAASREELGVEVASQVGSRPQAIQFAGAMVGAIGLIPGMPKVLFLLIGAALVVAGQVRRRPAAVAPAAAPSVKDLGSPQAMEALLTVEPVELLVGSTLVGLAARGDLQERMVMARRQITQQLGLLVPPVHIRDAVTLGPRTYTIMVWGAEVGRGELHPDRLMAIPTGANMVPIDGMRGTDPTFGGPAVWIEAGRQLEAERAGYLVVPPTAVVATHVVEELRRHASELLTRQTTREMVEQLRGRHAVLLDELVPKVVSLGTVQRVLQGLLAEGVSVRTLPRILEAIADGVQSGQKDSGPLVETVRRQLGAGLWQPFLGADHKLPVLLIEPALQDRLRQAHEAGRPLMGLSLSDAEALMRRIVEARGKAAAQGVAPVLLTAGAVRSAVRKLLASRAPVLPVLAYEELAQDVALAPYGLVGLT